jgi:hypothetical protein
MNDLEKRVSDLERRLARLEPHVERNIQLGPRPLSDEEVAQRAKQFTDELMTAVKKGAPPADRSAQQLVSGAPVPEDQSHTKLKDNGQQQDYVVLTVEERAKGFVRPVRNSYRHVGPSGPKHPLRDLDPATEKHFAASGYVKFEQYPGEAHVTNGRLWMQEQLDAVGKGCGTMTTMGQSLAETYARDPKFYGGTFCCGCSKHLPVDEFVWEGTNERVGS